MVKSGIFLLLSIFCAGMAFGQQIRGYERTDFVTALDRRVPAPKDARSVILPSVGIIPHVAIGGAWKTIFTVINNHPGRPLEAEISFWSSSGNRMPVSLSDGSQTVEGNYFVITLPPMASLRLETVNRPAQVQTGWVDIFPSALHGTAFAVFRAAIPGKPDFESLVTMEWAINDLLLVPFDNRNGFGTAVAIANGWSSLPLVFDADICDEHGNKIAVYRENLAERAQAAFQTADRWPATRNRAGTILLRKVSGHGVGALALLFNPSGAVTTSPAIEIMTY